MDAEDTSPDREALQALSEALFAWGNALEWEWRFRSDRATAAVLDGHARIKAAYARLSEAFHARHPELAQHYPGLVDNPRGDVVGAFHRAVQKVQAELEAE